MPAPTRLLALALPALLATAGAAHAASFDCKAAKSPTEKAICGSPKLSALDEKLAREYERASHALSPAGAASLKDSQRSWLRYAAQVCTPRSASDDKRADCLEGEFGRRLGQLAQAGVRVGPWLFNRVDVYAGVRAHDDSGGLHGGYALQHAAWPQIDAPVTPASTAWNAAQRKDAPGTISVAEAPDDVAEDDDDDYRLGCAGERFIAVRADHSEYQHGAAHGSYEHAVSAMLLRPSLRKMAAADFFAPGAPWKAKLPGLFWDAYRHTPDAATDVPSIREAIEASAVDPDAWLPTPEGLQIAFSAYEAGCYACNPGSITVPWSALKPMLAAPDLASCQAPPAAGR